MIKSLLFICVFLLCANAMHERNELSTKQQFLAYMKQFNKHYTQEEFPVRYENFKASISRSSERNANSMEATYGLTKFSDMSVDEFKSTILMKNKITPPTIPADKVLQPKKEIELPTSFDWRTSGAVTAVKNQEQCGSCWAFSATENIESMWILAGKADNQISLAPQQIVDCDEWMEGCNGGETSSAFNYVMSAGGLEGEAAYPYTGEDGTCNFQSSKIQANISTWNYATSDYSETTLQQNLVSWGPLSVCVDASAWQDYQSGVMTWEECAYVNLLDHCVQLVGYNAQNETSPYWIVRNSWGTDWGVDGYIWLQMWTDTCGIAHDATCVVI